MKLKRLAEDFQVEEHVFLTPSQGDYALYELTKQSLGTLEAIHAVARHWKLPQQAIQFAGLKDKHALTTQYITIHRGPHRGLKQSNLALRYVGPVPRPIHASDIRGNRFTIVLRDLDEQQAARAAKSADTIRSHGLPNYFDDQRFGSLGQSGEFIARSWCLGDYERAIWLAIAEPASRDSRREREEKAFLREHWGDWPLCRQRLPRSPWSGLLNFLANHPGDFRRAIAQAPHELRSLWLAAYQSHLWNQILAAVLKDLGSQIQPATLSIGRQPLPFFIRLPADVRQVLADTLLPLPSARLHLTDDRLAHLYEQVLAAEGIELRQLRVKYPRDTFFSKGQRAAIFVPQELQDELDDDELYAGRRKLTLHFLLPRSRYATIVVKRVQLDISTSGDGIE